jgi:ribonucleotide monophosphatase NagD (HAD superfamily)
LNFVVSRKNVNKCAGITPVVVGKPSQWFVDLVREVVNVPPERCLMIGDRLDTDIAFGRLAGFQTLLVSGTGVHGVSDLCAAKPEQRPNYHNVSVPTFLAHL